MADAGQPVELVASFFTLAGSGFADPPRHGFAERCRAAADAGFAGIGLHAADLPRTVAAGLDADAMRAVLADTGLRLVEIEFLGGWAVDGPDLDLVAGIEAVADAFGGRHVSTGEFRPAPDGGLDLDAAAARLHLGQVEEPREPCRHPADLARRGDVVPGLRAARHRLAARD